MVMDVELTNLDALAQAGGKGESEHLTIQLEDFRAVLPMHAYCYLPTREIWPAASINGALPKVLTKTGEEISASKWLDINLSVHQLTWMPGASLLIQDVLVGNGGQFEHKGATILNLYRPPVLPRGNAAKAIPWIEHMHKVFGDDANHIIMWLAHRIQRPQEKINHAIVLGGAQGIGKDTLLEPVQRAVGAWNFAEISPTHLLGRYNSFARSVILRINEARDLGGVSRYQFYDHMKTYAAAPPDVLRVDEKHLREYNVMNCCGVIIGTNYKTGGIYLPPDDRRHYVAWSNLTRNDFSDDYWNKLWRYYDAGGYEHVHAYLAELDISKFNVKNPPTKTEAFWAIVDANRHPEDSELADVLDQLGNPDAVTLARIANMATGDFAAVILDRKNRRAMPHRLERCGYQQCRSPNAEDGLWRINGRRQAVYTRIELSPKDQFTAASRLVGAEE